MQFTIDAFLAHFFPKNFNNYKQIIHMNSNYDNDSRYRQLAQPYKTLKCEEQQEIEDYDIQQRSRLNLNSGCCMLHAVI